jgi:hypothetical protein
MNTAYRFDRLSAMENDMYGQTVVEMQKEYARWGDPNNIPAQMLNFANNHLMFQSQLAERTAQVRNHIQSNFSLPNQVDLTLNVYPEGAGKIQISTITPDEYPWQGVYFNGLPVKIEAIANEGFNFLYWGNNGLIDDILNPVFLDTLNTNAVSFDAYFDDLIASVPSIEKPDGFSVYPNPANSILYLKSKDNLSGDLQYQIIDVNGRVVKEGRLAGGNNQSIIDIKAVPSSVYLLRIFNSNGLMEQIRFVKI